MTTAIVTELDLSKKEIVYNVGIETETKYKSLIGETWKNIIHDVKKIRKNDYRIDDFNLISKIIGKIIPPTFPILFIFSWIIISFDFINSNSKNEVLVLYLEALSFGFLASLSVIFIYGLFIIIIASIMDKLDIDNSKFINIKFNQKDLTTFQKILLKVNQWLVKDKEIIKQHKFNYDIILLKDLLEEYNINPNRFLNNIDYLFYKDSIPNAFKYEKTYDSCINDLLIPQTNYKDIEKLSRIIKLIIHAEQNGINKDITIREINKIIQFSKTTKKNINNDLFDKYFLFINENKLFKDIAAKFKKHNDISKQQYEKIEWEISELNDTLEELKRLKDKNPQYCIEEDLNEAINDIDFNKFIQNTNANNENIYIETLIYQLSIINKTISYVHQKYINLIFAGLEPEI